MVEVAVALILIMLLEVVMVLMVVLVVEAVLNREQILPEGLVKPAKEMLEEQQFAHLRNSNIQLLVAGALVRLDHQIPELIQVMVAMVLLQVLMELRITGLAVVVLELKDQVQLLETAVTVAAVEVLNILQEQLLELVALV